mgnify:CR=1 FL=1
MKLFLKKCVCVCVRAHIGVAYYAYSIEQIFIVLSIGLARDPKVNGITLPTGNSQSHERDRQKQAIKM